MISERQGPTRSEQTNQLLTLCKGALDGLVADEAVREALDARERALDEARTGFAAGVAQEVEANPDAQQWHPFALAVLTGFDEYKKALSDARGALRQKGAPLETAMKAITTATERLFLATEVYEARLVSVGSSAHPMQNFLVNMTEAMKRGDLSRDAYADILVKGRSYFQSCMGEMRNAPESEPPEAIAALLAAFGQCHDAVLEMERFLGDGDERHLDVGLTRLEEGQTALQEGFSLHRRQKFAQGPTSSPVANTFIAAAQMVKQGQYPVETFASDLVGLREHLAKIRSNFEGVCQAASSAAAVQEEIPRAMEAFDIHLEAIEAYERFVERRDPTDIERGTARLIEAIKRLDEAKMTFESIAESEGKVHCPRCGALNANGLRVCGACSAALPWVADGASPSFNIGEGGEVDSSAQAFVFTENMKRVIEETNKVAAGEISGPEYCATLDWMGRVVDEGKAALAATPTLVVESFPEEERERAELEKGLVEETRQMLSDALDALRASLEEMRAFVDDGDQDHLVKGLREFWDASQQVHQVQRVGEMAAQSGEMLAETGESLEGGASEDGRGEIDLPTSTADAVELDSE